MFLNSWSLALSLCSLIVIFLGILACRTGLRVLRFWNPSSDSNRQIRLESEIWLSSTLVEYGLGVQIITLVLFVLAADHYCDAIVGAMCATGALLANDFGMPALLIKLIGVFFYGFWIVLHQLDIQSEQYPLVRIKYIYLLFLLPIIALDITLQTLYVAGLKPDIITSCCAVVFSESGREGGANLLLSTSPTLLLWLFYGTVVMLGSIGIRLIIKRWKNFLGILYATGWLWFFLLAMVAIITIFSSYIYAMPFHNCPFCILKPEYNYIGLAIYGTLIPATFFGTTCAIVNPLRHKEGLAEAVSKFQLLAVKISVILLLAFACLTSYHYIMYIIFGGES